MRIITSISIVSSLPMSSSSSPFTYKAVEVIFRRIYFYFHLQTAPNWQDFQHSHNLTTYSYMSLYTILCKMIKCKLNYHHYPAMLWGIQSKVKIKNWISEQFLGVPSLSTPRFNLQYKWIWSWQTILWKFNLKMFAAPWLLKQTQRRTQQTNLRLATQTRAANEPTRTHTVLASAWKL